MSLENTLPVLQKRSTTYKMIIPKEVENKIKHTCNIIHDIEWSGILFYTIEGTFKDNNLVVTCKDFFVMDIGNATYTEFSMNPDVIAYMTEHQELLDYQMALIHSHNTFATFLSGTDICTLQKEGNDRNNFVSLIVNNEGTYSAAITRKVKSIKTVKDCYSYEFFDKGNNEECKEYTEEEEIIEYFMLNIVKEGVEDYSELENRLKEIKETKQAKKTFFSSKSDELPFTDYNNITYYKTTPKVDYSKYAVTSESDLKDVPSLLKKDTIKSIVLQLLTGSIVIPNESKIDINKWIQGMPSLFEKRFGKGDDGITQFRAWAEGFVEYLVFFTNDFETLDFSLAEDEITSTLACELIEALDKLPQNNYIKIYIQLLANYIQ